MSISIHSLYSAHVLFAGRGGESQSQGHHVCHSQWHEAIDILAHRARDHLTLKLILTWEDPALGVTRCIGSLAGRRSLVQLKHTVEHGKLSCTVALASERVPGIFLTISKPGHPAFLQVSDKSDVAGA